MYAGEDDHGGMSCSFMELRHRWLSKSRAAPDRQGLSCHLGELTPCSRVLTMVGLTGWGAGAHVSSLLH